MSVEQPLWRALAVFRLLALGYAIMQYLSAADEYRYPYGGWAVMGVLTLWTLLTMYAFEKPELRGWPVLSVDLALAVLSVLATRWLDDPARVADGALTLPTVWSSAPVLAWAIKEAGSPAPSPPSSPARPTSWSAARSRRATCTTSC